MQKWWEYYSMAKADSSSPNLFLSMSFKLSLNKWKSSSAKASAKLWLNIELMHKQMERKFQLVAKRKANIFSLFAHGPNNKLFLIYAQLEFKRHNDLLTNFCTGCFRFVSKKQKKVVKRMKSKSARKNLFVEASAIKRILCKHL